MAKATRDALPRREREIMNALFALGNRATAEDIVLGSRIDQLQLFTGPRDARPA